jgi:hypothetical protein
LEAIGTSLEKSFSFLLGQLGVSHTTEIVKKHVQAPEIHQPLPAGGLKGGKTESTEGLAD